MEKTLYVCEVPWSTEDNQLVEYSMQPFLQAMARLHDFRLLYRTFTSGQELKGLLSSEFPRDASASKIVYIASHGSGGRLSAGFGSRNINLKSIAESTHRGIEGVWVSACEVGGADSIREFLRGGGAVWAGGYTCDIGWERAMLTDLAILNEVLSSDPATSKEEAIDLFARALCSFNPSWNFGWRGNEEVYLRNAIRLEARTEVQGSRAEDVTDMLLKKLQWDEPQQKSA